MSEVKRFRADHRHVVETEFDDAQFVGVADFDRVTAERDAAMGREAALRKTMLSTVSGSLESERNHYMSKTIRFMDERDALQVLLTAADERADVLEGLLAKYYNRSDVCAFMAKDIGAALKPAEGADYRKSCEAAHKALSMENQRIIPARFKCLACGEYHEGSGNLPCPRMSPYSRIDP